jgi:hypothetical protein
VTSSRSSTADDRTLTRSIQQKRQAHREAQPSPQALSHYVLPDLSPGVSMIAGSEATIAATWEDLIALVIRQG